MKKRITVEQLQELTDEQKQKLREWWKPEIGDVVFLVNTFGVKFSHEFVIASEEQTELHDDYHKYLPLINMGQMIELLLSKKEINGHYDSGLCTIDDTDIELSWEGMCDGVELCDALWQAVKAVL